MKARVISGHCMGGGRDVFPGDVIDLDEKEFKRKIAMGYVIAIPDVPAPAAESAGAASTSEGTAPNETTSAASASGQGDTGSQTSAGNADGSGAPIPEATPEALELAKEHGIDLTTVVGTGENGRIKAGDVKAAIAARG